MRQKLQYVSGRMQCAKLARIMNSWVDFIKARQRLMTRLELMMIRFVQRRLLAAFRIWRANVVEGAEARTEAERQAKLSASERERKQKEEEKRAAQFAAKLHATRGAGLKRILRRVMNRVGGAALDAWWASVVDGREKKAMCRKILYRVQSRHLALSFNTWIHAVNTLQRQRHVIARALARVGKVTKQKVLLSWASAARRDRVETLTRRAEAAERVLGIRTRHNMAVCVPLLRQLTNLDLDPTLRHEVFALFDFLVPKSMTSKRSGKAGLSKEALDLVGDHAELLDIAARGRSAAEAFENPQQSAKRFRGEQRVVEIVNSQLTAMQLRLDELEDRNRNLRIERETAITRVREEMEKKHKFDIAALRRLNAQETRTANERARLTRVQSSIDDRMLVASNNSSSALLISNPTHGMMPPTTKRVAGGGGMLSPRSAAPSPIKMSSSNTHNRGGAARPLSASSSAAAAAEISPSYMVEGTSATKSTTYRPTTFQPPGVRTRMAFE